MSYTSCNRDHESLSHLLFLEGGNFLHPVNNVHAHPGRNVMAALVMLVSWKIWSEYNARVFKNSRTMATTVLTRIKLGQDRGPSPVKNTCVTLYRESRIFLRIGRVGFSSFF
jgi:hypothetical protein